MYYGAVYNYGCVRPEADLVQYVRPRSRQAVKPGWFFAAAGIGVSEDPHDSTFYRNLIDETRFWDSPFLTYIS